MIIILNNFLRTAGQETDERDNNATVSVSVKREVVMEITGYIIHLLFYTNLLRRVKVQF